MRSKLVLAALVIFSTVPVFAQVAPAVKIGGLPLGVGVGITNYDSDYYFPDLGNWSGRLTGVSAWADYNVFHGLGVEVEGTTTFAGKPTPIFPAGQVAASTDLKESSIQGGLIYKYHRIFKVRPFVKVIGGWGKVDFPSANPFYTSETSGLYSAGGGIEYRIWNNIYLRGEYEYQWWKGFQGSRRLDPNGLTIGATYYLRGLHGHR